MNDYNVRIILQKSVCALDEVILYGIVYQLSIVLHTHLLKNT